VSADAATIFVRLGDVVGTDGDKPAIANLHLAVEFKKPFSLSAVLGAETAAAGHRAKTQPSSHPELSQSMGVRLKHGVKFQ
jgi:hypothetical protein